MVVSRPLRSTNADLKTLNQLYNIQDSEESSPNPRRTLVASSHSIAFLHSFPGWQHRLVLPQSRLGTLSSMPSALDRVLTGHTKSGHATYAENASLVVRLICPASRACCAEFRGQIAIMVRISPT